MIKQMHLGKEKNSRKFTFNVHTEYGDSIMLDELISFSLIVVFEMKQS